MTIPAIQSKKLWLFILIPLFLCSCAHTRLEKELKLRELNIEVNYYCREDYCVALLIKGRTVTSGQGKTINKALDNAIKEYNKL